MTEHVFVVKRATPIYRALELLVEHNISGAPVVEDDMTLVGVLSEKDVLKLFYEFKDAESKTVDDYMTQPAVFFDEKESLLDICDCLSDNYFRRVPVTSKGKLVGVVSRRDIIKEILKTRSESVVVE